MFIAEWLGDALLAAGGGVIALMVVFWILVVVAFIVAIVFLAKHFEKKRTESLMPVAESLGMEFSPDEDEHLLAAMQVFKRFNLGHSRKMRNVMKAETESAKLAIFDYRYTTGHGKNQTVHKQTVFAMQTNELKSPKFLLRPEGFLDKIGSMIGGQDIDFDSHPKFSKLFVLQGDSEEEVRRFFDAKLLEFFEQNEGLYVEAATGAIIFFRGKQRKPEEIRELMDQGYAAYAAIAERASR